MFQVRSTFSQIGQVNSSKCKLQSSKYWHRERSLEIITTSFPIILSQLTQAIFLSIILIVLIVAIASTYAKDDQKSWLSFEKVEVHTEKMRKKNRL